MIFRIQKNKKNEKNFFKFYEIKNSEINKRISTFDNFLKIYSNGCNSKSLIDGLLFIIARRLNFKNSIEYKFDNFPYIPFITNNNNKIVFYFRFKNHNNNLFGYNKFVLTSHDDKKNFRFNIGLDIDKTNYPREFFRTQVNLHNLANDKLFQFDYNQSNKFINSIFLGIYKTFKINNINNFTYGNELTYQLTKEKNYKNSLFFKFERGNSFEFFTKIKTKQINFEKLSNEEEEKLTKIV